MQDISLILQLILAAQILVTCIMLALLNFHGMRWIILINFLGLSTIITLIGTIFFVYQFSLMETLLLEKISLLESRITDLTTLVKQLQLQSGLHDILTNHKPSASQKTKLLVQSFITSAVHMTVMHTFSSTFLQPVTTLYATFSTWQQVAACGLVIGFGSAISMLFQ